MKYAFVQNATSTWRGGEAWIACPRDRVQFIIRRIAITTNVPFLLGAISFQLTGSYAIYITFTARAGVHYGNERREGHTEPRKD